MSSSQDTEITLGTSKLLVLFFGLVAICALFFALGYSLGRTSEPSITMANAAGTPQAATGANKSAGNASGKTAPMTFYKAVEQKDANPELTPPPADAKSESTPGSGPNSPSETNTSDTTTLPTNAYFVQVAAVTKQEDADALVGALKKKQYPAFVASGAATDNLLRIQVGPFYNIKEAEAMRAHLISDGYNPILKK